MVNVRDIVHVKSLENGLLGVEIKLPNSPPLIIIVGNKGFIMCGYLDINVANKLGLTAARVVGVKSVEEMVEKEISQVSEEARKLGIKEGSKVKEALSLI